MEWRGSDRHDEPDAGAVAGTAAVGKALGHGAAAQDTEVGAVGAGSAAPAHVVLDISAAQASSRLIGKPVWFEFVQDSIPHVAFGQITSVYAMAAPASGSHMRGAGAGAGEPAAPCPHRGAVTIGAVLAKDGPGFRASFLGTLPATGTPVYEASDALACRIAERSPCVSYVGRFYGAAARFPVSLPPLAAPDRPGYWPYKMGIYGAKGSGKAALARTLIGGLAESPGMSILVLDQDGSFAGGVGPLQEACKRAGKRFLSYGVGDLVLDRWDLFYEVLRESDMLKTLLPDESRRDVLMGMVRAQFRTGGKHTMARLSDREAFDSMMSLLESKECQEEIYPTERHVRTMFARRVAGWRSKAYEAHWLPLSRLFSTEGRKRVSGVVRNACEQGKKRPVMVMNLSKPTVPDGLLWNDGVRAIVARRIIREVAAEGEDRYGNGGRLDMLAVLCGAEEMAPRCAPADPRLARLRDAVVDAVRSSGEYGLSFMFIAGTLAGLHPALYSGNRMSFCGAGLVSEAEVSAMSGILPAGFAPAYRALVRRGMPHGAAAEGGAAHPFMSTGRASPLSATEDPAFFTTAAPA